MLKKERDIQSRVLFVALAPVIATAIALALYFTLLRYSDVDSALQQRGVAMARQLAPATQYGLFSGNTAELKRIAQTLTYEPDVSAVTIYDKDDKPLVDVGNTASPPLPHNLANGWQGQTSSGTILLFHSKVFAPAQPLDDPYSTDPLPNAPNSILGSVTVEMSRDNLWAKKREILFFTLGSTILILLVAALIARRLGRDITEPILVLEATVRKIRDGFLSSRVQTHSAGTLRLLEEGINTMAAALEKAEQKNKKELISSNTQLQQQNDFANALLEAQSNAGVSFVVVDRGMLVFANQVAITMSGLSYEQLSQLEKISAVLAPEDRENFESQYSCVLKGELLSAQSEVKIVRPDGTYSWAEHAFYPVKREGSVQIVLIGIDITQRKQDAHQLLLAHQELQIQKDAAEHASAAKSRFLAAASHDLRQPIHALSLFSDQLRKQIRTPQQSQLANQIYAAVTNMSELLTSLLSISKLDLLTLKPERCPVELDSLLSQIASQQKHTAESKKLRLIVAPTSLWIMSNPAYLSRILSNLISNALRYTRQGGILIGARRAGKNVRIEIWDTGIGISPEHIPLLFQEFYQVENPERNANKGLGLGLSIVDRVAMILEHTIEVRSKPGRGSLFSVTGLRTHAQDIDNNLQPLDATKLTILLVIADRDQQNELAQLLRKWNYIVLLCFVDATTPYDLVIFDSLSKEQVSTMLRTDKTPKIFLYELSSSNNVEPDVHCTILATPVKPAKLRALIMHLTTNKN